MSNEKRKKTTKNTKEKPFLSTEVKSVHSTVLGFGALNTTKARRSGGERERETERQRERETERQRERQRSRIITSSFEVDLRACRSLEIVGKWFCLNESAVKRFLVFGGVLLGSVSVASAKRG